MKYSKAEPAIPILAYHKVLPENRGSTQAWNSPFTISTGQFKAQLGYLYKHGYQTIGFADLPGALSVGGLGPAKRPVVVTFDDGWQDNYEFAWPILKTFNFRATFFVISGEIGATDYMTWQQLQEMQKTGMEIASHTHTHQPLELLSAAKVDYELQESRRALEDGLGRAIRFISFPHGSYTRGVLRQAEAAGYIACGTSDSGYATPSSQLLSLPRVMIRQHTDQDTFERLCRSEPGTVRRFRILQRSKSIVRSAIGVRAYNRLHRAVYKTQPN